MRAAAVLVVDDAPEIRALLTAVLKGAAFEVEVAADAPSALTLMQRRAFRVLITDVEMPGLSGIELTRRVTSAWPDTRVVVMSGSMDERMRVEAERAGADAILQKPFSPTTLLEEVYRVLRQG